MKPTWELLKFLTSSATDKEHERTTRALAKYGLTNTVFQFFVILLSCIPSRRITFNFSLYLQQQNKSGQRLAGVDIILLPVLRQALNDT